MSMVGLMLEFQTRL